MIERNAFHQRARYAAVRGTLQLTLDGGVGRGREG
jgi:hypothetical protein